MKTVEHLLLTKGPMLGSQISAYYQSQGLKPSAARQRVNRRSKSIKTLYGLPFPKNTRFLYLESQFGTARFFEALISTLQKSGPAYASAIAGLRAKGGMCLRADWDIISGSPRRQKGHVASEEVLRRLIAVKMISVSDVAGIGECVILVHAAGPDVSHSDFRARLTMEYIARDIVKNWAVRMCYSSTNAIEASSRMKTPQFGTFCFDIVGPSYLHSLITKKASKSTNGFFVCDVLWSDELTSEHVGYFIRKVETVSFLKNIGKFQSMLVANSFTPEALRKCRSKGITAVTPETLLGRDVANGLNDLFDVLRRAAAISIGNPEKLETLFDRLSIVDGLMGNVRGSLFEMIVAHVLKKLQAGSIDIGAMATDHAKKRSADIDVRLASDTDVLNVECKGYGPDTYIGVEEVQKWLTEKVPIIYAAQANEPRFSHSDKRFEFWTTAKFDDDALAYLEQKKAETRKYKIDWREGHYILEQSKKLQAKAVHKMLKTHFFSKDISKVLLH